MATQTMTNNQKLGYVSAVGYAALGFLGFTVTGVSDFASSEGAKLFGFIGLNPFTNGLHLLMALVFLIGAASGFVGARGVNLTLGLVLVVWGVLGFVLGTSASNIFASNAATSAIHLAWGAVLVAAGNKRDYPTAQAA